MMDIDWDVEPTNAHEEILWSDLIVVVMFWVRCSVSVYYFSSLVVFFSIFVWFYTRVPLFALWSYRGYSARNVIFVAWL
jgi:hypothetical protein